MVVLNVLLNTKWWVAFINSNKTLNFFIVMIRTKGFIDWLLLKEQRQNRPEIACNNMWNWACVAQTVHVYILAWTMFGALLEAERFIREQKFKWRKNSHPLSQSSSTYLWQHYYFRSFDAWAAFVLRWGWFELFFKGLRFCFWLVAHVPSSRLCPCFIVLCHKDARAYFNHIFCMKDNQQNIQSNQ